MGTARVVLTSGKSFPCVRNGGDDAEAANAILNDVVERKGKPPDRAVVYCDSGGGFDANEVAAVVVFGAESAELEDSQT